MAGRNSIDGRLSACKNALFFFLLETRFLTSWLSILLCNSGFFFFRVFRSTHRLCCSPSQLTLPSCVCLWTFFPGFRLTFEFNTMFLRSALFYTPWSRPFGMVKIFPRWRISLRCGMSHFFGTQGFRSGEKFFRRLFLTWVFSTLSPPRLSFPPFNPAELPFHL